MNEKFKYKTIKKLVETNSNKKRATLKLNCSIKTIGRLIIKYKKFGKNRFINGNSSRLPSTKISFDVEN